MIFEKILIVIITMLFFLSVSFAQELTLPQKHIYNYSNDDLSERLGFTALCSMIGAAGGALVWYIKFSKEYSDNINDNIDEYLDDYQNYDSIEAWLESKKKEKEKAKNEVVEWIIGGAVVGALFGVVLYPEQSRTSLINLYPGEKSKISFPKVRCNIQRFGITVPLFEYRFK